MAFQTKLNLTNAKFYQCSGDNLALSGSTSVGTAQYLTDQSGSYTARSLVDAAFVTGQTANVQSQIDYLSGQTDLRLTISDFESYTGVTDTRISNIETDLATVSGQTDTNTANIVLNTAGLGTVSAATDLNTAGLATVSAATDLNTAGLATVSAATDLNTAGLATVSAATDQNTSDIAAITALAVTGATNGLTKSGQNAILGGALTQATDISGLDTYDLTLTGGVVEYSGDYSAQIGPRSIPDAAWVTGQTGAISASNGLTRIGSYVTLGGTLTGATSININGQSLTFSTNPISYAGDYSSQYVARSIVDAGYVTGITSTKLAISDFNSYSATTDTRLDTIEGDIALNTAGLATVSAATDLNTAGLATVSAATDQNTSDIASITALAITGATNGLTKSGQNAILGGALTQATDISALNTYDLTLTGGDIKYSGDYSSQFTARSIPDAAWVTGQTGAIDAQNGLTRNGNYIELGGALTGDTTISGSDILLVTSPFGACCASFIDLTPDSTHLPSSPAEGMLYYSACSLNFVRDYPDVILQIGEEEVLRIQNNTGGVLNNGEVVYIAGSDGDTPTVEKSIASNLITSRRTIGVVTHNIPDTSEGFVTLSGFVRGLNTSSWAVGTALYLSSSVPGGLTSTKPDQATSNVLRIGYVIEQDTTEGSIYVDPCCENEWLLKLTFTGYTATTDTRLSGIESDVATVSAQTDTNTTNIATLTSSNSVAITGVTNGLTKVGSKVARLGGALTQGTSLTGAYSLTFSPTEALVLRTLSDNSINIDAQSGGAVAIKSQSGTVTNQTSFTNAVGIFADYDAASGFAIYDNRVGGNRTGIVYAADYSANYVNRSLVDKAYVDSVATGLAAKASVAVATTTGITLSGLQTIDSISIQLGDRVLVKDQVDPAENGIYSANTGAWGRTTDFDFTPAGEVANGDLVPVISGDSNANTQWILTTADPITSGDSLNFSLFSQLIQISAGNGIDITPSAGVQIISVELSPTNPGLTFDGSGLELDYGIYTSGLTVSGGEVQVCANTSPVSGSEIDVHIGAGNNLVVDSSDFSYSTASNGLTKVDSNITLGGTLTGNTSICGDAGQYDLSLLELDSFNLSFDGISTISDLGTNGGLRYGDDYSGNYTCRSLVDAQHVNDVVTGNTLTYNNGITKSGKVVSWGGTLTGDTAVLRGSGRICMSDAGSISCVNIITDGSVINVCEPSILIRSCTPSTCLGSIALDNSGTIALSTNKATSGITVTDTGSGRGIVYASDYSGTFAARSLVDKAYVDSAAGGILASNGLTRDGNYIILGGTLTGNTLISGDSNTLCVTDAGNLYLGGDNTTLKGETGDVEITAVNETFKICGTGGALYTDSGSLPIKYAGDYSTNYDARSLVDSGFVTGITSSIETNYVCSASNGLTKTGNDVALGGALTQTTTINGAYTLNVNVSDLNLTGTTVDITGTVTLQTTPATGDAGTDAVLVWDSVDKQIKQVDAANLGEDNNRYAYTGVSNSTINLTGSEYVVLVDASLGAVTVNLPASPVNGTAFKIKDTGNALTNNITVQGNGYNIDGSSSATINTDYGALELVYNGTAWFTLAFIN